MWFPYVPCGPWWYQLLLCLVLIAFIYWGWRKANEGAGRWHGRAARGGWASQKPWM